MSKVTKEISCHFAARQGKDSFANHDGPVGSDTHVTLLGTPVLFYSPKVDKWNGLYSFFSIQCETAILLLPHPSGPTKFCMTVVKSFLANCSQDKATQHSVNNTIQQAHIISKSSTRIHVMQSDFC